ASLRRLFLGAFRKAETLATQLVDLVAQARRLLELEVARVPVHPLLELLDPRDGLLGRQPLVTAAARLAAGSARALAASSTARRASAFHDVLNRLANALGLDS